MIFHKLILTFRKNNFFLANGGYVNSICKQIPDMDKKIWQQTVIAQQNENNQLLTKKKKVRTVPVWWTVYWCNLIWIVS